MANTTVQEPQAPQLVPPAKNGRGKAPKPQAEEAQPARSGKYRLIGNPDAQTFAEWLDSIGDDDWTRSFCYVYRAAPVTDRQSAGKPTHVDKIGAKFDLQEILKRHGSGRYRFDFCYVPRGTTKYERVAQEYETLLDMTRPPKVGLGEWTEAPANKDWAWAKPLLEAEEKDRTLKAAAAFTPPPQEVQSKTEELGELLELAEKLRGKDNNNAGLLIELIKMNDPSKVLTLAKEIASVQNPGASKDDGAMALLMKFIMEELREARASRAAVADPLETATKLLTGAKDLFGTLGMGAPATAAAAKADTTSVIVSTVGDILGRTVDKLGEYAPNIMALVSHLKDRDLQIAEIRARQGMNPDRPWEFQGSRTAPVTRTINTQPQPTGPIITPPPAAQTAPVNAPPPAAPVMTPQLLFQKYNALLNAHFVILIDKFKNETGFAMQDHLLDREGRNTFNQFREDSTVDLLMGLVASNGQLKTIFTPPEKARQFFEELLSEPPPAGEAEDDDDDDEEDGDGPIGASQDV